MFTEAIAIIAVLAVGAFGWRFYRGRMVAARKREEEEEVFGRHDHARAYEKAKAQAELSRWSGPH